jgi:putative transposase
VANIGFGNDDSFDSLRTGLGHTIRDDTDFQRHVDYIHWNPVKHGLTKCVADWPYSSFHKYVRIGLLSREWATAINEDQSGYGESA